MIRYCKVILIFVLFCSCDKIDNYPEPNGGIYGKLTDDITNQPLQSEQPNGFTVKLFEDGKSLNAPISFGGRADGSFENSWVFQNKYKVLFTEGAFFPVDTMEVNIGSHTEANVSVTPFLAVTDASVTPGSGQITATYKIKRTKASDKIVERKTLVSKTPIVNNALFYKKEDVDVSGIADDGILNVTFTDVVSGLEPGTYYVRVCVRTNNALKKYNYSETFLVSVP